MKNRTIPSIITVLLILTIAGSVTAQDQRGTDTLPLVVKLITDRATPLPVTSSTDWPVLWVALSIGILQLIVFGIQSYLLWETVLSSNLPKIIVRRITIVSPDIDNRPVSQPFHKDDHLRGRFAFTNIGRRRATITQTYSMFFVTDKPLPMRRPYDDGNRTFPSLNTTLLPGWEGDTDIAASITIENIPNESHWKLYAMGWIDCIYKPLPWITWRRWSLDRSVGRVYFCRVWSSSDHRFVPVDNPDYESG